ncbi:MAG: TrkH family potassium uptake protein [Candidatus Thiodiazotropha sp. (ex Dulcina madagascariensis)]|nr:TrkH family potassium uptake protein [Candidatus Thiodiazotropha sp. (ex Epidulcina cf. delphinae)]MCU7923210.1 TrkH family potassium uptake protein [Candidatus Thiodiazotropha sp. (ex Dulcina madagascariensis)]MCU7924898.1 TrkH family potassium uptake protein [Candidatus Thiodiazotropha sp. (ex Dulcina madagascariensis)]
MHLLVVQRILGVLLMVFSLSMLPPLVISIWVDDGALVGFTDAFILTLSLGLACWAPVRNQHQDLRVRDGFLVVVMFWGVLGLTGSLPFLLAENSEMTVTDAIFESISGLTTTGATVIVGIDQLPLSILYYRQQLQWLGGMGIIVLAVAVLPMLGIGGMQLYRAETPGPVKDNKLTPRITETAKALWFIYLGLTIICTLAYWGGGMKPFDALGHAFSTVAIGGFSTHDESIGFYDSTLIEMIAVIFMLLSGANFALHFLALRRRSLRTYFEDSEFRGYITTLTVVFFAVSGALYFMGVYGTWNESITRGLFQAVSIGTTTGFTTAHYSLWPGFISILLLFASFVGGCAGSTGGGIKVIRFLLLIKQGVREINRLIHPNAEIPIRIGGKTIPWRVVDAVWGFFALYVASFGVMYLALASTGLDLMTSFSAVAASINNLGPGLADVGEHYANLNNPAKWILCIAMLLGRLEIFTLLVLLTPAFWRK